MRRNDEGRDYGIRSHFYQWFANRSKKTIKKLLARGVIVDRETNVHFKDGLPPVAVGDYFVPLPIR